MAGAFGSFPGTSLELSNACKARKHICGMTGDGVNDALALKKADISIIVGGLTDTARRASDIYCPN